MKLEVNISKKIGVISITSNSFVLEDLKTHICKKMKLDENDFKMKISFDNVPKVEMIEVKHEVIEVIKQPPKKPKGSQDSDYRTWIEEQKDFLRILWSDREMSSISDIQDNTSFYNQDNTLFCIYALSENERIELLRKTPYAWENIQEYRFIFRLTSLYISLKGSEVFISSIGGFKYKIFDMKSKSSVNEFMRGK